MRESTTGAETDTYPKDGENSRSSKLSADLAKKQGSDLPEKVAVVHDGVRCSDDQGTASHRRGKKPENKEKKKERKKTVSREGLNPVLSARDQQLLAAHTLDGVWP